MTKRPRFKWQQRAREQRYAKFWAAVPEPKLKRRLIEDQPDTWVKPVNYDELPIG